VDVSLAKNVRLTERFRAQFRIDAFNFFNHPNYGNPGSTSIGFSAPNTVATPEFMDAGGHGTTSLANAVSLQNTTPSAVAGTVSTQSDRGRVFQYSVRFTF
jgi:hypothetical protein